MNSKYTFQLQQNNHNLADKSPINSLNYCQKHSWSKKLSKYMSLMADFLNTLQNQELKNKPVINNYDLSSTVVENTSM